MYWKTFSGPIWPIALVLNRTKEPYVSHFSFLSCIVSVTDVPMDRQHQTAFSDTTWWRPTIMKGKILILFMLIIVFIWDASHSLNQWIMSFASLSPTFFEFSDTSLTHGEKKRIVSKGSLRQISMKSDRTWVLLLVDSPSLVGRLIPHPVQVDTLFSSNFVLVKYYSTPNHQYVFYSF